MPSGISPDSISAQIPARQAWQTCSINPELVQTPILSCSTKSTAEPEINTGATNPMLERYTFKNDEIKRNTKYSHEKIALSSEQNAQEKNDTAALSVNKKSGLVQINLKKDIKVKDLKALYNIQDGILRHYNELPYETTSNGDDFDEGILTKGQAVIVPPSSFEYQGKIAELWSAITR